MLILTQHLEGEFTLNKRTYFQPKPFLKPFSTSFSRLAYQMRLLDYNQWMNLLLELLANLISMLQRIKVKDKENYLLMRIIH